MDDNLNSQIEQAKAEIAAGNTAANGTPPPVQSAQPTIVNQPSPGKKPLLPPKLQVALFIFTLASGAAVAILPNFARIFGTGDQPSLLQLALTGTVLIVLTAGLLSYVSKVIGLGKAWLLLAMVYNSLIIIVKFILSPASLYGQTFTTGLFSFDPNNLIVYVFVGLWVMMLYVGVFNIIHAAYQKKVKQALDIAARGEKPSPKKYGLNIGFKIFLGLALLVGGAATGVLSLPLFFALPTVQYLSYVFAGMGIALFVALGFAIFSAIEAFDQAKNTAIEMRDGTVVATFFWLGLSLILIYHALWIIYMTIMLSIWPFKTISASGK